MSVKYQDKMNLNQEANEEADKLFDHWALGRLSSAVLLVFEISFVPRASNTIFHFCTVDSNSVRFIFLPKSKDHADDGHDAL